LIEERNEVIGHEVGTDIFGPYVGATIVSFVDKASGKGFSKKLQAGKKGLAVAVEEMIDIFKLHKHPIKTLVSDSENAYRSENLVKNVLNKHGVTPRYSPPGEKEYNGLAEKHHDIVRSKAIAMLACAQHLSEAFWVRAWMHSELANNHRKSRMHGSNKTRYEEFFGVKPDYKKLVMAPFGHPCIYRLPKEARPPGLSMKGRLGVYIGPSQSIIGGIMVYSFATKRVIDTATYRLLGAVPSAFTTYNREVFVPSAADMLAILVDEDAPGIVTSHRQEEANKQMAEEDRLMNEDEVGDGEVVAAEHHRSRG
jgi:hypothetical protein